MLGRCQWCGTNGQLTGVLWSVKRLTADELKKFQKKNGDTNWLCRLCYAAALEQVHAILAKRPTPKESHAVPDDH